MKKVMIITICLFLVLAGCSNPVKDDLLNYINNELPKFADDETTAIEAFDFVSGDNYEDDYTMYEVLDEIVIPHYREFLRGIEGITVRLKTKEVRALNEKYIEAGNTQINAFTLLMNIIETQDSSKITDFNERMDKARRLVTEWQVEIQDLCKKNGVTFNPQW